MNLKSEDVRGSQSVSCRRQLHIFGRICVSKLTTCSLCLKRRASWIPEAIRGGKVYRIRSPPSAKLRLAVCKSCTEVSLCNVFDRYAYGLPQIE